MTDQLTPEGPQEAADGRVSASTRESEARDVQAATDAAERRTAARAPLRGELPPCALLLPDVGTPSRTETLRGGRRLTNPNPPEAPMPDQPTPPPAAEQSVEQMARALAAAAVLNPQRDAAPWDSLSTAERDRYREQAGVINPPAPDSAQRLKGRVVSGRRESVELTPAARELMEAITPAPDGARTTPDNPPASGDAVNNSADADAREQCAAAIDECRTLTPAALADAVMAVRDRRVEALTARIVELEQQLADADAEALELANHNDQTCEAVKGRDVAESELAGARATIDHMTKAMSWISGHDRQGLDHLEEAQYEARSREAAVEQARRWAVRARTAEATIDRVREVADIWFREGAPGATREAGRYILAALNPQEQPDAEEQPGA